MHNIKAVQTTFLKKANTQSSELPEKDKFSVEKGREFPVEEVLSSQEGHYYIKLAYGAGKWYIYSGHWKVSWEDTEEQDQPLTEKHKEELEPLDPSIVDWLDSDCRVSRYFRVFEVTQNDPRRIPDGYTTIRSILNHAFHLDVIREEWARYLKNKGDSSSPAIAITSWYRPPLVNREVGGVENSRHILGSASDSYPVNGQIWEYQRWLNNTAWSDRALGLGANKGFCHLDERGPIRWNY